MTDSNLMRSVADRLEEQYDELAVWLDEHPTLTGLSPDWTLLIRCAKDDLAAVVETLRRWATLTETRNAES